MPKVQNDLIGKKAKAVPKPKPEVGIDLDNTFIDNILEAGEANVLDIAAIDAFTNVAQTRESIYSLIDTMSRDCTLAAVLESYVEDSTETNEKGQIVWCESNDGDVAKYVSWLIETLNIDKNVASWVNSLIKYGDVYLKLFRQSDYDFDPVFNVDNKELNKKSLNEDIKLKLNSSSDHFVHYVELVKNPGEMFELTRFGKTMGYIQAPIRVQVVGDNESNLALSFMRYQLKRDDVKVFGPTDYVHACLEDNTSRTPEEVNIFLNNKDYESKENGITYSVRRGQSILSNIFKTWRELSLLENSVLLNRLTKSSIVRTIQVEVGDMPKDKVQSHLMKIKNLVEQKSAINTGVGMSEYTNPGPVENNIYIPTHDGKGSLTVGQIGGDVDPKSLIDLDWFNNRVFGSLGVPKQFFGFTDDGAGFNGGTSLTILSSKYGKAVKKIQNTICQLITDLINNLLIDKGLTNYINKFIIRMQAPVTQEEKDRRENNDNRIRYIGDVMNQLADIQDPVARLKILKSLLTPAINDPEVISILEDEIEKIEAEKKEGVSAESREGSTDNELNDLLGSEESASGEEEIFPEAETQMTSEEPAEQVATEATESEETEDSYLPSFSELGVEDGTDASNI